MHSKSKAKLSVTLAAFAGAMLAMDHLAQAQTDVWTANNGSGNASGSFNTATNWSLGNVPTAAEIADLSQQSLTTTSTVTLDGSQTISAMTFGNTNAANSAGWVINTGTGGPLNLNNQNYNLFTVNQLAGQNEVVTINAALSNSNDGVDELAKAGNGTLVLTNNNTALSGTVAVNAGILELDFSHAASPTNILGDDGLGDAGGSHLQLQGGELLINGAPGQTNSQTFSSGMATELGDSSIVLNQNGATSLSVNLGPVTHNWASSLDITLPTAGTVAMSFGTGGGAYPGETFGTTTSNNGLLVDTAGMAFATVNGGSDWAAVNASNDVVAASSISGFYTPTTAGTITGNADVVTNVTVAAATTVASMRFNGPSSTININSTTLTTGGILMTPSASGNMVISNGTLNSSATNELFVDQSNATQTLTISANITGGTDLLKSGAGTLVLSGNNTYSGWNYFNSGTVSITGGSVGAPDTANSGTAGDTYVGQAFGNTATLNISAGTLTSGRTVMGGNPGNYAGGTGTINQTGGTINSNYWFSVGTFGTGTYNMSGGILNTNPAGFGVSELEISVFSSGSGTVNLSGTGQINIDNNGILIFGDAGSTQNGTFNQNGGTVTFYSDGGTTVGGTGGVQMGQSGTGIYTYNLNAGTLTTNFVNHGTGQGIFNFNGGTLRAASSSSGFVGSLTSANIEAGGAIIDSNGNNIGVSQPLVHAASLGATADGGLTKLGAGTLQLSGASTYTGSTIISAGTVQLPSPTVPVAVASYSLDGNSVTNGVLNPGAVITNSGSGGSAMNGAVNITDWQGQGGGAASGVSIVSGGPYANSHALQFDGLGTSVDIPSQIVNQSSSANWTFSTWIQTTTPGSSIMSKNQGADGWATGNSVFYLASNSAANAWNNNGYPTAVRFAGGFIQGTPNNSPPNAANGQWNMITYVDSGGSQSIYMNGQPLVINVPGFTGADISTLTRLGINVDSFFAGDGNVDFAGNMDDLNFFDVALNSTQIGQLYANNLVTSAGGGGQYLPINTPLNITASGATLDLNGENQTIGSLAGVAGSAVKLGGGILTAGGNNGSTNFAGSISGSGGIVKQGSGTWSLTGANTYTGGTTVNAGALVVGVNGALPNGAVTVTGGTLQLGVSTGLATIKSLAVSGTGTFDVNNDHVIINYGSPASDPISSIAALLKTGYNHGNWNGAGGIISTAAQLNNATAGNLLYGVGYADAADAGNPAGLASGTLEIKYTLLGDANLSGVVDGTDFGIVAANFNKGVTGWDQGDFNYDNVVDGTDFGDLAANFNKGANGASVGEPAYDDPAIVAFAQANGLMAELTSVPEPASIGLLTVGACGLMARRRRMN